jgi:hypothetical protein
MNGSKNKHILIKFWSTGSNECVTVPQYTLRTVTAQSVQRLGYGLDDRSFRVQFPVGAENFPLYHHVQNGSGAHPASYPMGTRGSFPGGKAARA